MVIDNIKTAAVERFIQLIEAARIKDYASAHNIMTPQYRLKQDQETTKALCNEILGKPIADENHWIVEVSKKEGGYIGPHSIENEMQEISVYEVVFIDDNWFLTGEVIDLHKG